MLDPQEQFDQVREKLGFPLEATVNPMGDAKCELCSAPARCLVADLKEVELFESSIGVEIKELHMFCKLHSRNSRFFGKDGTRKL